MGVEEKRNFLINSAYIILIGAIFYFLFKFCFIYLLPFMIGILLAVIVQKPAKKLAQKTHIGKGFFSVVLVLALYVVALAVITALCIFLYDRITKFLSAVPGYLNSIMDIFDDLKNNSIVKNELSDLPKEISEAVDKLPGTVVTKLSDFATNLVSFSATAVATGGPGLLVSIIVTVVSSCYFSKDYDVVTGYLHSHVSARTNLIISEIKSVFFNTVFKLAKSYAVLMALTFVELSIGFFILGVSNPIGVAGITAVVDILPVLGTGSVVIPWAIISLLRGKIGMAVGLALLYLIITVVRNFLEPKIVGDQVGLHPLVTLVAIFVGLKLFGILGMLLAPLLIIVLLGLYKKGIISFSSSKFAN